MIFQALRDSGKTVSEFAQYLISLLKKQSPVLSGDM